MFPVDAFQNTILEFAQILNHLSIRFHLTGGITSLAYGEPRMTQDVDVVIDPLSTQNLVNELIIRLKHSRFLFDENTLRNAVAEQQPETVGRPWGQPKLIDISGDRGASRRPWGQPETTTTVPPWGQPKMIDIREFVEYGFPRQAKIDKSGE